MIMMELILKSFILDLCGRVNLWEDVLYQKSLILGYDFFIVITLGYVQCTIDFGHLAFPPSWVSRFSVECFV